MTPPRGRVRLSQIHRLVQHATMVACPIRLQERCEIFIARVFANGSRPEHGPVLYAATEDTQRLGYSTMKPEQLQVAPGIVSVRDVFAVLPTGFGKSLCYACPPTVFGLVLAVEGTSIVFAAASLMAIMKDQVSVASRRTYLRPQSRHNVAQ